MRPYNVVMYLILFLLGIQVN